MGETERVEDAVLQMGLERLRQETERFNSIQNRAAALLAFDGALLALVVLAVATLKPPIADILGRAGASGWLPLLPLAAWGVWMLLMLVSIGAHIISLWPLKSPTLPVENITQETLWSKPDKMQRLIEVVTRVAAGESRVTTIRVRWFKVGVIALGSGLIVLLAGALLALLT